jgi:hypothetical protein
MIARIIEATNKPIKNNPPKIINARYAGVSFGIRFMVAGTRKTAKKSASDQTPFEFVVGRLEIEMHFKIPASGSKTTQI